MKIPRLWLLMPLVLVFCASCKGSASMRIDVEVYKGPLSKEPLIQFADLLGFVDEIRRGLEDMDTYVRAVSMNKDFANKNIIVYLNAEAEAGKAKAADVKTAEAKAAKAKANLTNAEKYRLEMENAYPSATKSDMCRGLDPEGIWDQIDFFDCFALQKLRENNKNLLIELTKHKTRLESALLSPTRTEVAALLTALAQFAGQMRKNPFSWSIPSTAGHSPNFKVRTVMVLYIVMTAEYGNQLHARIDSLMKQMDENPVDGDGGFDRKELPLSVYISDTEPTDFIHLFDQWDAASDRSWAWPAVAAIDGTVKDRITMVKRLFADHHWSKINTAYASGWGKTKMAFVKDDIGNWNLKNFDNAPEDLLQAYTILAKTALDRAATLAMELETGGGATAIDSLVKLSRSVSMPSQGQGTRSSAIKIADLHNRTEIKLREIGWEAMEKEKYHLTDTNDKRSAQKELVQRLREVIESHEDLVGLASTSVK